MITASYRDPVDGGSVSFLDEDGPYEARLWLEISQRHWLTAREIYEVLQPTLADSDERQQGPDELQRDANLLKLPLPMEEALAIWERARDFLLRCAEHSNGERRAKIERFLAERDAAMAKLRSRAQ